MKIQMFLPIVLTVCTLPQLSPAATCTGLTSKPSEDYTLRGTYDLTVSSGSACTSKTTKYYTNATDKTYVSVTTCNSCSGTGVVSTSETLTNVGGTGCDISVKYCSTCTNSTTQPSGSQAGSYNVDKANGCTSTSSLRYVYYAEGRVYVSVKDCTACESGYYMTSQMGKLGDCPIVYTACATCYPGQHFVSGQCVDCTAGTYSDTSGATTCTTCPDMTGVYTDAAHTKVASVANGAITSAVGANSKNKCYLTSGTYYNSVGAFRYEGITACYYDGTYEETPADKCTDITYGCRALQYNMTSTSQIGTGAIPSGVSGKYCFCSTNGRYFYMTSMGSSDTDASACEQSCINACTSVIKNNQTLRTDLGC